MPSHYQPPARMLHALFDGVLWVLVRFLAYASRVGERLEMRSIRNQLHVAKFPVHPGSGRLRFRGVEGGSSPDQAFCGSFLHRFSTQHGADRGRAGKTHLAKVLGVSGINHWGKRVRFFSTVDLVNALD